MPEPEVLPTPMEVAWARTTVAAETPTGRVRVTMTGDDDLRLWIDPTWYAMAPLADVEAELARAAKLTYVARTRTYYETWSRVAGMEMRPAATAVSPEQETYLRGLEEITARGEAYDGRVVLTMVGLSHFAVSIEPPVLRELDAVGFAAVGQQAALECLRDHNRAWQRLHFDVYTRPGLERAGLW